MTYSTFSGSLTFTKLHLNKYWRFTLETWIIIHAGVVAAQVEITERWSMFVFGFATVIFLTQVCFNNRYKYFAHFLVNRISFYIKLSKKN